MDDFMIKKNYLSVQFCVGKLCERENTRRDDS